MQQNICISASLSSTDSSKESVASMFDHLVQQAIALQQAGRPQDAERLYRAVLQAQPNHPNASHQLTELLELTPHYAANLLVLKATLEANPNQSQCWLNYINALIHTGHPYAALGVLQTARERGIQGLQGETADALVLRLQAPITGQPAAHEIDSIVALYDAGHYSELLSAAHTGDCQRSCRVTSCKLL